MATTTSKRGDPREMGGASETNDEVSPAAATDADADAEPNLDLDAPAEEETLELDEIFHILQNERRRQVLLHLEGVEGKVEMRNLAEKIAAWENDTTVENLYSDQRQRVYIALYQSHLPKLDELGVIDYNQSRGAIEPTPLVDEVLQYLKTQPDDAGATAAPRPAIPARWLPAAVSAGIVATVLVMIAWIGMFPATVMGGVVASVATGMTAAATVGATSGDV